MFSAEGGAWDLLVYRSAVRCSFRKQPRPGDVLGLSFFRVSRKIDLSTFTRGAWKCSRLGVLIGSLLKIAMDLLDDQLDEDALERGDMVFNNNSIIAHARDAFVNDPNSPPRHLVRAWLQVQKADIVSFQNEDVDQDLRERLCSNQT